MNVGYVKTGDLDNPIHNEVCPLCGNNIYVSKYYDNFACTNSKCSLYHGAKNLANRSYKINDMLKMLD